MMKLEKVDLTTDDRRAMNKAERENAIYKITDVVASEVGVVRIEGDYFKSPDHEETFQRFLSGFHKDFIYQDERLIFTNKDFFGDGFDIDCLFMTRDSSEVFIKLILNDSEEFYGKLI